MRAKQAQCEYDMAVRSLCCDKAMSGGKSPMGYLACPKAPWPSMRGRPLLSETIITSCSWKCSRHVSAVARQCLQMVTSGPRAYVLHNAYICSHLQHKRRVCGGYWRHCWSGRRVCNPALKDLGRACTAAAAGPPKPHAQDRQNSYQNQNSGRWHRSSQCWLWPHSWCRREGSIASV